MADWNGDDEGGRPPVAGACGPHGWNDDDDDPAGGKSTCMTADGEVRSLVGESAEAELGRVGTREVDVG